MAVGLLVPIPTFPVAVFTKSAGIDPVATFKLPHISSLEEGVVVPTPTLPSDVASVVVPETVSVPLDTSDEVAVIVPPVIDEKIDERPERSEEKNPVEEVLLTNVALVDESVEMVDDENVGVSVSV